MSRSRAAGTLALAVTLLLTACGGDDDDAATGSPTGSPADADLTAFCENAIEIETLGEPDVDFETASPEEVAEATKAFARDEILPVAREVDASAPEEIADDVDTLIAATEELAETGDFEATFETPEVQQAEQRFHEVMLDSCDIESVDLTMRDYEFDGIPESLEAGVVSFDFTNEGDEFHELVVFRRADGVTESWDEILEAEDESKAEFVAGGFAPPGEGDFAIADLEPGDYIAVCFVPVGATPAAEESGEEPDGPPHFSQGMRTEFTVE